ncbi:MAG: tetratricopeptide repeat protein, partial [Anaerolineales bacterium]|nr:tetratricopeptide repeat protein [Anaerolineales bacterium]
TIANHLEEYEQSLELQRQAMDTMQLFEDRRGIAVLLLNMSDNYFHLGNREEAIQSQLRSLAMLREIGDLRLVGISLINLAFFFLEFYNDTSQAVRFYRESLDVFHSIKDLRGTVYASYDMANAYLRAGQISEAHSSLTQALFTASETTSKSLLLHVLHGFARLYQQSGRLDSAIEFCSLILSHPASESDTRKRAASLLSEVEFRVPTDHLEESRQQGQHLSLEDAVARALLGSPSALP